VEGGGLPGCGHAEDELFAVNHADRVVARAPQSENGRETDTTPHITGSQTFGDDTDLPGNIRYL